jgi:S-(hydroxymethyl)glutathione dehydrogenase/alcohol dehydrogenase
MYEKEVRGALFGSSNAQVEIPRILNLYRQGQVKLDELVTTTYTLRDINQGYEDMRSGRNIRGMVMYGE